MTSPNPHRRALVFKFAAAVAFLSWGSPARSQEISVSDDASSTTLIDGQAAIVDFGCTMPGSPVSRMFTVSNTDPTDLVLPANGLSLPAGYSLTPGWPTASVTPEFRFEVNAAGGGVVTGEEFSLHVVSAPGVISVTNVTVTIPLDPAGSTPPPTQLPYVDSDGTALVSIASTTAGIDTDPVSGSSWLCPTPGTQSNPNGDICFEFADQIFTTGNSNRFNRKRTFITQITQGVLTGSLDTPASNGILTYGVAVEGMNPPAIPGGGDNGDGDNYGIGGIEVFITVFNSLTGLSEVITGELVDDGIDNDHSEVTLFSSPVLVPVPIILGPGDDYTFNVQLDAVTEGVFSGPWSLANNDADENPFNFPITGIVDGTAPTITGLPANIVVGTDPPPAPACTSVVTWAGVPGVSDNLDPSPTLVRTDTTGLNSGDVFPVGVTTIEYTATDCAGNVTVDSFTVTVQDQTPPTLIGSLPKQIIAGAAPGDPGVIVNFPGLTAMDDCDPDPVVTCTPPSGSLFPLGLTEVCCVAVDSSGNMSLEACFNVIVIEAQPSPSPRVAEEISKRNGPAPGVAGATMQQFYNAYINEVGGIAIEARMNNAGTNNFALWKDVGMGLGLVAREGDVLPGGIDGLRAFDEFVLNDAGDIAFRAALYSASAKTDRADFNDVGGAPTTSIVEGGAAPGGSEFFVVVQQQAFDAGGNAYMPANLLGGIGGVTAANDTGIWIRPSGLPVAELAREGSVVNALPGVNHAQIANRVVTNDSGEIAYYSFLEVSGGITTANNAAIFSGLPGAFSVVSQEGLVAPGPAAAAAQFQTYSAESINNAGRVAFEAGLKTGGGGAPVTSATNSGLYANSNGPVELVAREGDAAPCLLGPPAVFSSFREIFIVDNGDVFFRAFLKGGSVNSTNDGSIWRWQASDATLHPVAREGDLASSTAGSIFAALSSFSVSNNGILVITALLVPGVGDCTASNNGGLWMDDGTDGLPILKAREGDTSDIGLGNATDPAITLVSISSTTNQAGGSGGHGKIVNDAGEVIVRMGFDQNSNGVFVLENGP